MPRSAKSQLEKEHLRKLRKEAKKELKKKAGTSKGIVYGDAYLSQKENEQTIISEEIPCKANMSETEMQNLREQIQKKMQQQLEQQARDKLLDDGQEMAHVSEVRVVILPA